MGGRRAVVGFRPRFKGLPFGNPLFKVIYYLYSLVDFFICGRDEEED